MILPRSKIGSVTFFFAFFFSCLTSKHTYYICSSIASIVVIFLAAKNLYKSTLPYTKYTKAYQ